MSWIKEVEMVDALKFQGYPHFPIFEMLDARIASALNKIIQNSHFKEKVSLEEQKAQTEDGPQQAGGDPRGSRTCVCAITLEQGGTCRGGKGE